VAILIGYLIGALISATITCSVRGKDWQVHEHVMVAAFWPVSVMIVARQIVGRMGR
jgi:hypothetical protein